MSTVKGPLLKLILTTAHVGSGEVAVTWLLVGNGGMSFCSNLKIIPIIYCSRLSSIPC